MTDEPFRPMAPMTPEQKRRYVRHLLLPEIGAEGQAKLCLTRFSTGDAITELYLQRSGLISDPEAPIVTPPRLETSPDLQAAADVLVGAFAAVERIKAELDVGSPGALEVELE